MKSNTCSLTGKKSELDAVFTEVDKCASYNGLDAKSTLRLRLLAEELSEMLPSLLENAEGTFWVENDGNEYELHLTAKAYDMNLDSRDRVIAVSKSGKNAAAVGIMGKIRAAAEAMLLASQDTAGMIDFPEYTATGVEAMPNHVHEWTMRNYVSQVKMQAETAGKGEAWDELEKSIIANLADDVIVGVRGRKVSITVCKKF